MPSDPETHHHASRTHDAMAERHEKAAVFWTERDDPERAELERRNGAIERDAAALERDKAALEERRKRGVSVRPTAAEVGRALPGDEVVPDPTVTMDRAFTLPAPPAAVWPWFVQLGKRRGGWSCSRRVERFVPARRRGLRHLEPRFQGLAIGDVIPDWGGKDATFEVVRMDAPHALVHRSRRGRTELSWAIVLHPAGPAQTRVQLRLRLAPIQRPWLANSAGAFFDWVTVAALAGGLRERVGSAA